MLSIPSAMQASLDAGVTSHAWCWRVRRSDDAVFGFTDHDRDLEFDGLTYRAGSGFGGADIEAAPGLAPSQGDLAGALDSAVLTEADLAAGVWGGARVECWRVDWSDPALRVLVATGELGEVRRIDGRFEAELLGLAHRLERVTGRVFTRRCDASLGDARCGVSPEHPDFASGCDQRLATCGGRFANIINFRGFPHMVGNDVLQASAASEAIRDGGSRG
ncbi:DUF2163 domain-containing protein [Maricaulis sp.]|uniref:DUF2163 domain-containing protein n=1 Tax=Maricaulis sp. TaxID=1486257 RepID=UPI003A8D5DC3